MCQYKTNFTQVWLNGSLWNTTQFFYDYGIAVNLLSTFIFKSVLCKSLQSGLFIHSFVYFEIILYFYSGITTNKIDHKWQ